MKKKIAVLALGVMAVFFAGQEAGAVMASGPTASAELDWTTFQVQTFDMTGSGAPTLVRSGESEASYASAGTNYDYDSGLGWTDAGVSSTAPGSYAAGWSNNEEVGGKSQLDWEEADWAYSGGQRFAQMDITGTGLLVVSVDYSWQVSLAQGQSGTQSASAWTQITLHDVDYSVQGYGYSHGYLPDLNNPGVYFDQKFGKLVASLYVTDGMTVYFDASASTQVNAAPVPVPPALLLLGSGLFGLVIRKKKSLA